MKIKELIEQLKKYDPEMLVVVNGYEGGRDDINIIKEEILIEEENNSWYDGKYSYFEEKSHNLDHAVKAIFLCK
jgi:uncharacterized coiled-coil DUF342 family protein